MPRDRTRGRNTGFTNGQTAEAEQPVDSSFESVSGAIYGRPRSAQYQVAPPVRIDTIHANRSQPRRTVPTYARGDWMGGAAGVMDALTRWHEAVEDALRVSLDLPPLIEAEEDILETLRLDEYPEVVQRIAAPYLDLIALAGSIYREGLINAITVVKHGDDDFEIETGERRWVAYHILRELYGDEYSEINAREVKEFDVWRQAAENNARMNLTAIGRARQYALLVMALHSEQRFHPIEQMPSDLAFYQQALTVRRLKDGAAARIMQVLGVTSGSALVRCRALLAVKDEVWDRADDENLSEREIGRLNTEDEPKQKDTPASQPTLLETFERRTSRFERDLVELVEKASTDDEVKQIITRLEALTNNLRGRL